MIFWCNCAIMYLYQVHLSLLQKRVIQLIHLCELVVPVVAGWGGQVGHEDEELLLCTGLENFLIRLIHLYLSNQDL